MNRVSRTHGGLRKTEQVRPAQTQTTNAEDQMRDPMQPTVELRLRDGTEVKLRPIQPGDGAEMVQ